MDRAFSASETSLALCREGHPPGPTRLLKFEARHSVAAEGREVGVPTGEAAPRRR